MKIIAWVKLQQCDFSKHVSAVCVQINIKYLCLTSYFEEEKIDVSKVFIDTCILYVFLIINCQLIWQIFMKLLSDQWLSKLFTDDWWKMDQGYK